MNPSFEYITHLEYRLKASQAEVRAFRSGKKFQDIQEMQRKEREVLERELRALKRELMKAHQETKEVRNQWFEVFEDLQKEQDRKEKALRYWLKQMEKRALKAEENYGDAQDKIKELRHGFYEVAAALEEEKGKNLKLMAQVSQDFENSSFPSSSQKIRKKKVPNNRKVTGKHPGGQPGHTGHRRKRQTPTCPSVLLQPDREILNDPDFKKTNHTITKQLVNIKMVLEVTDYYADVYRNSKTGETYHAEFPAGIVNDVNYGGSIKAFLFLLNNECCTSIDKSRRFLSDLTGGKLQISKGMINQLSRTFAQKSKVDQKKAFSELLVAPILHTDCTNARVNGKNAYVFICAKPDGQALYTASEKKGHEGVKGTPAELSHGILIHDHELTFYNYGSNHQECLAHVLRYLKGSMENEPDRVWNKQMHTLIREMIHYRNGLDPGCGCDTAKVAEYETRYRKILEKAKEEYEEIPCNDYYKEGYNLSIRMDNYMKNHLLFLHDHRIPTTNNLSERLLRKYKRKQVQAVSFRSFESIKALCECMSVLLMIRERSEYDYFENVSQIFEG